MQVALHTLSQREGPPLLALHALGASHLEFNELAPHWPGPVFALDFAGHGASDVLRGRAYSAEQVWVMDADTALAHIGRAYLVGRGLGAYVALMLAGTRTAQVPGALLLAGRGLAGGGEAPDAAQIHADRAALRRNLDAAATMDAELRPDPMVFETESHHRPVRFARSFAERATKLVFGDACEPPPPWWRAAREVQSAAHADDGGLRALTQLAAADSV